MLRIGSTALLGALIAGCMTVPVAHDAEAEAYGPAPVDPESIVRAYLRRILSHPDSIEGLQVAAPAKKVWIGHHQGGAGYGHLVCSTYRARSSAGTPIEMRDGLLIRDGSVVLRIADGDWFGRKLC